ncbi:MAG: hypothetical protein ACXW3P_06970, partial [Rhodospirillales bacterium]
MPYCLGFHGVHGNPGRRERQHLYSEARVYTRTRDPAILWRSLCPDAGEPCAAAGGPAAAGSAHAASARV